METLITVDKLAENRFKKSNNLAFISHGSPCFTHDINSTDQALQPQERKIYTASTAQIVFLLISIGGEWFNFNNELQICQLGGTLRLLLLIHKTSKSPHK